MTLNIILSKHLWNKIRIQLKIHNKNHCNAICSHSEIFTEQVQTPSSGLQQNLSEDFSVEQTQAQIERLKLQQRKRIKATNRLSGKRELERSQFIQQLNQSDTEIQNDSVVPEMIPSTSKRLQLQQNTRSELETFIFHNTTERRKRAFYYRCSQFCSKTYITFSKISDF